MVKITKDTQVVDAQPGAPMRQVGEAMDIPFGCENGICGTCEVVVTKGKEHLTPLSPNECEMGLDEEDENYRLLCQCSLRQDTPEDAELEIEE